MWFSKLPASSIANFEQLNDSFVRHFIGAQRHKRPTSYLLTIRQQVGESLREYVRHFNKVVLEIDEADDQVIMTTFQARLNNPDLIFFFRKDAANPYNRSPIQSSKVHERGRCPYSKGLAGKRKKDESNDS